MHVFRDYLEHSTFHGLRFIAEEGRHWTERVFWLVCCLLSWFGSAVLIISSWDSFMNNAISFVVETTYLDVDTKFPTITVCEEDNMLRIYDIATRIFGEDHDCNLDEVLKEIAYFRGTAYYIKEFCFSGDIDCPKNDYKALADMVGEHKLLKVRSPCPEVFGVCKWRGEPFDCCKHFLPLHTELGLCYSLSSKNEKHPDGLQMFSNTRTSLGSLYIELLATAKVYMHSDADIPFYNTMTTDVLIGGPNTFKVFSISVTDIDNEPEVHQLTVRQRKCRFPEENPLTVTNEYSYSACVTQCRKKEQLRICNCTSHLMPNSKAEEQCDIEGILCMNNHYSDIAVQKTSWSQKPGLNCDCLPGCDEPEYNIITVNTVQTDYNFSAIEIKLDRLPTERYKRNVVRRRLDLVVSMGGAAGLFVGASLLSFAEFIYYFTIRVYGNRFAKKGETKQTKETKVFVQPATPDNTLADLKEPLNLQKTVFKK